MEETQDFKSLQDRIQAALISTTRTSGQISSEDLGFQRALNPELGARLDEQSARLLALSKDLLKSAASISELRAPVLEDQEDVENNWRNVVDVIDSLLEKTDTSLDEYTGFIKRKESPAVELAVSKYKKPTGSLGNAFRTQNIVKPQLAFTVKPDNMDESPWKPLLTNKPHATIPLEESLGTFTNDFDQTQYKHPYETEILQLQYPHAVYQKADPISYLPFETTSATFVDNLEGVMEMLEELKTVKEIAIDLEHHDARSYVGLVSLMQISTRNKDWVIDTLKPWRQELQVLNQVFANPSIVKVLHGAYMDIVWLQRDLGLYIVGLFDTHHASQTLGYQGGSLAFLLKKFINFDADKKYQLADWRIRPIPEEMFFYARADTHFLLYIYDNQRNELIDRTKPEIPEENRMEIVLQKSKETSLLRYERQVYQADTGRGPGGWYPLLKKSPSLFNNEQFAVFRAVHAWRDKRARIDDDSTAYVMPNYVIFSIAKLLPQEMVALLSIAPLSHSAKSRAGELLALIKSAKASGKDGPSMIDVFRPDSVGAIAKANIPSMAAKSATPNMLVAAVDEGQLRSEQSSFWGGAFGSSIWDAPAAKIDDMRLDVPLPALSSEIFEPPPSLPQPSINALADRSRSQAKTPIQASTPTPKIDDGAFVLKRGGKRKNDAISEPDEPSGEYDLSMNVSFNDEVDDETREKAERKAARRAEKRARKKLMEEEKAAAAAEMEEAEPFDYSKAKSVLHGTANGGDREGSKKNKKPFDPYVKSADAPKGMRRLQTERPGKSHTFKG